MKSRPRKFVFIGYTSFLFDPCAGLTGKCFANGFGHGNEGGTATLFEVADDGVDFGSHAAFGKVSCVVVLFGLAEGDGVEVKLVGLLEIEGNLFYSSGDEEKVGMQF